MILPEPLDGRPNGYKLRLLDPEDSSSLTCTLPFNIVSSKEVLDEQNFEEPYLTVFSPWDHDLIVAGQMIRVQVS